ncbi:MAG: hypothetical protein U0Q21_15625 [Dermatophilaceae bacterium]
MRATLERVGAGLTSVQQRIFVAQGVACYRLPFVLPWPEASAGPAEIAARLRTSVAACPTLSARFTYDAAADAFAQIHDPAVAHDLLVTDGGTADDLDADCADPRHQPDLRDGGAPLTARVVDHAGDRHLALEFHHIAIDGVGIAAFEKHLLGLPVAVATPQEAFAAYERVAEREARHPHVRAGAWSHPKPAPPVGVPRVGRLGRTARAAGLAAHARQARVLPRIAAQAAFEVALRRHLPGTDYAAVGNWRWTLGLPDAVGNFPFLRHHEAPATDDRRAAAAALMESSADPTLEDDEPLADVPAAVFSYEQFGYRAGRFVPVDSFPKFPLYVRVAVEGAVLVVQAEFDRTRLPDAVAEAVLADVLALCTRSAPSQEIA